MLTNGWGRLTILKTSISTQNVKFLGNMPVVVKPNQNLIYLIKQKSLTHEKIYF